jgi:hypothetical protein
MPAYEYEVVDTKTGEVLNTLTLIRAVAGRDSLEFRRKTVPQRINFMGQAPDNPHDQTRASMKYLHRKEHRLGGPEFARRMGMSAKKAAEVWKQPEPATK